MDDDEKQKKAVTIFVNNSYSKNVNSKYLQEH